MPDDYMRLMRTVGYMRFSRFLKAKGIERVPLISDKDDLIPVAGFLAWREGNLSIQGKLGKFSEQLPERFIPFASGLMYDIIGFWYSSETEYKIGYWFHRGLPGVSTYHIANSFQDFVDTLIFGE